MGLEACWQQGAILIHQLWVWLQYEASLHPFLFLGMVMVIVLAWFLYKSEIRIK